jgi:hypothetical protein
MRTSSPISLVLLSALVAAGAFACSSSESGAGSPPTAAGDAGSTTADASASAPRTATCTYPNPFSGERECKAYTGRAWTKGEAEADCAKGTYGQPGTFAESGACEVGPTLGECRLPSDYEKEAVLYLGGTNASLCSTTGRACQQFLGGSFVPSTACEGAVIPTDTPTASVFQWPNESCVDPKSGEPAGARSGKVCTWNLIAGCTEPGRKYLDYGSCDMVRTQRPYFAVPGEAVPSSDPRLQDSAYLAEAAWIKREVEACACVCCHTDAAPRGASKWSIDKGPLWIDSMSNAAIAMFANYVDSSALGAYPAGENNGFDRTASAMPTTNPARMVGFFQREYARRGLTASYAQSLRPFGGPLVTQREYTPGACSASEGVDASGKVVWSGGGARYVYVLEAGSANPGVPPNYDMPAGVRWRVDVPHTASPMASGLPYGVTPADATQRFPKTGAAAPLVSGQRYYLYVLQDVGVPLARCTFTAP